MPLQIKPPTRRVILALLTMLTMPAIGTATTVRLETTHGNIEIDLLEDVAPLTVANFLNYAKDDDYDATFVHRSIPGFVVQGGGFTFVEGETPPEVPKDPPIVNEFGMSNIRGTVAMAKLAGDPDSATSEWFVNLADNSDNLDSQNGGFTVFGIVTDSGMQTVDAIAALPTINAGGAFTNLPVDGFSGGGSQIMAQHLVFVNDVVIIEDLPPTVAPLADITNDAVPDVALIRDGSVRVEARDGSTGKAISNTNYHGDGFRPAGLVAIPDISGNNLPEISALGVSDGLIKLRVSDAATNVGIRNFSVYSSGHDPVAIAAVTDVSGNAAADVAVLVTRHADDRIFVKVKDALTGATAGSNIEFLDAGFTPLGTAALPDIDSSGSDELVVFATRNSDGRGLVEIREADGSGGFSRVWFLSTGFTPVAIAVGDDADNNGIPEIAMLAERNSDQRIVVERRNASGPPQTTRHWFFSSGWQLVDFAAVPDTNDSDSLPEYAVLAIRNDGKPAVEIRNAGNPKATFRRFFMDENFTPLQVENFGDTNGNGVTNLGVLGIRQSDGRIKLELRDARDSANTKNIWFAP